MSDYISSRHGCAESSSYSSTMNRAETENPNILKDEFNIAWKVIHDDPFFAAGSGGVALKQVFMSITGTVVARKEQNGKPKVESFPSKVFDEQFMQKLMEGGSAPIYSCRDSGSTTKCLEVSESTVAIGSDLAIKAKVETLLGRMQRKVTTDEVFTDESCVTNKTRLPLLRILNVMSAYRQGGTHQFSEYADAVAIDIVCQYIQTCWM